MIVFTTLHNDKYKDLADITFNNKKNYCEKHNYPLLAKTDKWYNIPMGFEKAFLIKDAFVKYPTCEWVFFSECDTMITNMDIKLEDIIKNEDKHFVITTDINGINAGSFFVRNSQQGKEFLQAMIYHIGKCNNEQDFILYSYFISCNYKNIISLYPQKSFNSYDYYVFGDRYPSGLDMFGNNGRWEKGDFIIHFPDRPLQERIDLAKKYSQYVLGDKYPSGLNTIGNNHIWEKDEFIIHFPDKTLQERIDLARDSLKSF